MPISALDSDTARYLRTTQVITSVPYTVKELVENALDANAKNIEVNLSDNGLTHIEVKDDGFGISSEDAPFMALSHYTSKIKNFEDLEKLRTYGFRGEALNALNQVSEITIITRAQNETYATSYTFDSKGNIVNSELRPRSVGTTVQVKGLFKNLPVRRQVLLNSKRMKQDMKYMEALLKSFGIIQSHLRIIYRLNKEVVFTKSSANTLSESISNVLGINVTSNLERIEENSPECKIQLMIPKKDLRDPSLIAQLSHQFIFINNKILEHKELTKLLNSRIHEYYSNKGLSVSKKNIFFLNLILDPSDLDINLEPNKTKGFLRKEKEIVELINKILIKFYQLDEISEKENNVQGETIKKDSVSNDKKNDFADLVDEIEWPACKKRKVDCNRKSSIENPKDPLDLSSETLKEQDVSRIPVLANIRELNLSESDSNSDNDSNNLGKRRSVTSKRTKESLRNPTNINPKITTADSNDKISENEISSTDTDTLSQLPVVDLGEEFTQISNEKSTKSPMNNSISMTDYDTDSLLADFKFDNDFMFNDIREEKSALRQSTLSLNTSKNGEMILEVDKNNIANQNPLSASSWSRGHVPELKAGVDVTFFDTNEKEQKSSNLTGFNIFFSQTRTQVVQENPKMSIPQIAALLSNRWRELSCAERAFYEEKAKEKSRSEQMGIRKAKKEKEESEKNKKRLMKMLKSMKEKKNDNETKRKRTTVSMKTNIQMVTEKFNKEKSNKRLVAIGPIKSSLWIVKATDQYFLLNVPEMFKQLYFTDHNYSETNAETLEKLLERWTLEKEDTSIILHPINLNDSVE